MVLYKQVKETIIRRILDGAYPAGGALPTEQELRDTFGVSRVTVRKALDELKREGLIVSVQGSGTAVSARESGYRGFVDIIALIAEVHNPFFASFMAAFERIAEQQQSLVLFKQDFESMAFRRSDIYFRLLMKGIRNIVLWPQSDVVDFQLLRQVRTAGINLVIFDQLFETTAADIVSVDNFHAMQSLYAALRAVCSGEIHYIGYGNIELPSELHRRAAYVQAGGGPDTIHAVPWRSPLPEQDVERLLSQLQQADALPNGFLCTNGPLGLAVARKLKEMGRPDIALAAVDDLPGMASEGIIRYAQPLEEMAGRIYDRLVRQNNEGNRWTPVALQVKGRIVTP